MCNTMLEIVKEHFHDELDKAQKIGEANGIKIGEANGLKNGTLNTLKRVNALNQKLISLNRMDDVIKSSSDTGYQELLFQEFNI